MFRTPRKLRLVVMTAAFVVGGATVPVSGRAQVEASPPEPTEGDVSTGSSPALAGCSDLSGGVPHRLRVLRAVSWSTVPVGLGVVLGSLQSAGNHDRRFIQLPDALLGIGVSLMGLGTASGLASGVRLRRVCGRDPEYAARFRHRRTIAGWSAVGLGAAGFVATSIYGIHFNATKEFDDDYLGEVLYPVIFGSAALALMGTVLVLRADILERRNLRLTVGPGSLIVRGSF